MFCLYMHMHCTFYTVIYHTAHSKLIGNVEAFFYLKKLASFIVVKFVETREMYVYIQDKYANTEDD